MRTLGLDLYVKYFVVYRVHLSLTCMLGALLCIALKHLHNVETWFYCPQTFLSLNSPFGMMFLNENICFWG